METCYSFTIFFAPKVGTLRPTFSSGLIQKFKFLNTRGRVGWYLNDTPSAVIRPSSGQLPGTDMPPYHSPSGSKWHSSAILSTDTICKVEQIKSANHSVKHCRRNAKFYLFPYVFHYVSLSLSSSDFITVLTNKRAKTQWHSSFKITDFKTSPGFRLLHFVSHTIGTFRSTEEHTSHTDQRYQRPFLS